MTRTEVDLVVPVGANDHVLGPSDASVTLVEYGDYECPYCGEAFPVIQDVLRKVKGVRFVFRNFPLTNAHPYAERAAEAAEAASTLGHFWQMHDILYSHQDALDDLSLLKYAEQIGLDQARFIEELKDRRHRIRIRHDFMGGVKSGVSGTPYFFINGQRYEGTIDFGSLVQALSAKGAIT